MRYLILIAILLLQQTAGAQITSRQMDSLISYCVKYFSFEGVVIVTENNKPVYTKSTGFANRESDLKSSPDTKYRIGSLTKLFTSYILFTLVHEGKLRWEDKVCNYLPEFCTDDKKMITVNELIHHTSGIRNYSNAKQFDEKKSLSERFTFIIYLKVTACMACGNKIWL